MYADNTNSQIIKGYITCEWENFCSLKGEGNEVVHAKKKKRKVWKQENPKKICFGGEKKTSYCNGRELPISPYRPRLLVVSYALTILIC